MHRLTLSVLLLCGCAQYTVPDDATPADAAPSDAALEPDDGCLSWARPTGTCTAPGVCCVSSTCVMGVCR